MRPTRLTGKPSLAPRGRLVVAFVVLAGYAALLPAVAPGGETLYNGIVLPDTWPPHYDRDPSEPMPVPYLKCPPAVIPIDVGRQLLVDDYLIQETNLSRTFHQPEYSPANPVLKPDKPWENKSLGWFAAPFSGGVWFDPTDQLFKMWYTGGYLAATCYATSQDGLHWEKPKLDVQAPTNIVMEPTRTGTTRHDTAVDTTTVWLDAAEPDASARFKYFATENHDGFTLTCRSSPDGIHWSQPLAMRGGFRDRTTVFYNPFRKVWVLSERVKWGAGRRGRAYREAADPRKLVSEAPAVPWVAADRLDPQHPVPEYAGAPGLYNLDAAPYESLMLGLFSVWQGPPNDACVREQLQKRNDILLGYSRDGFHWHRPDRQRFIACSWEKDDWRFGNVQSVGGGCLVVGDKLYFYFSGRALPSAGRYNTDTIRSPGEWDADAATGLAVLRRDGFASLDAGEAEGTLTTRPLLFRGRHLFVNVNCPKGTLKAEVLDADGRAIEPFTAVNCRPLSSDTTRTALSWQGADDLSALAGQPVRLRFHLTQGELYAFWVAADRSGASHGYVAAGGPGFRGPTDTVGE